ncbi:hypothetical protein DSCO28_23950 [Desulfosarcina ovata subsp. sediminis]|uniref:Fido domain-containing protein n=1 Tax=Desulfosarcina ovata subsp. sediminis TaxID=885957 RepID=A0A5K7ZPQ0_9BACT|nr:Fic family protein [Desulfosarcina ovata]BBO81829.1 hypothetical protein DSCO28_23950 [Desulfosarcina ovata subsp. sediminis]
MATPQEKLASSLEMLRELQNRAIVAVRSGDLTRTHRERLLKNGFLQEVMKGWYIPVQPDRPPGDSTAWYTSFWDFCAAYLEARFGTKWSLSPEQSLLIHVGELTVPRQLLVRSPKARNRMTALPHDTSLFDTRAKLPEDGQDVKINGLRLFTLPAALVSCGPGFFIQHSPAARAALAMVPDGSDLLRLLLEEGRTAIAGRLAGAFSNIGRNDIASDIIHTMQAAGFDAREKNPFEDSAKSALITRFSSPYVYRMRLMWEKMREPVRRQFPAAPGMVPDLEVYLKTADDAYLTDAYHSLSIEGYRVGPDLIERVRSGQWHPDDNVEDREQRNALAARGYWQAYQAVRKSVRKVLADENPGSVSENDHRQWYREMFAPNVKAGLLSPGDLAGYRNAPVYIRRSMHVPPRYEAVRDLMPAFFSLLQEESEPSVRVVLGHFFFVYIHPYFDGNGRIGRFLMNVMLASGGYPWTVVPFEKREEYMSALEAASVRQDIEPFAAFLGRLVSATSPK